MSSKQSTFIQSSPHLFNRQIPRQLTTNTAVSTSPTSCLEPTAWIHHGQHCHGSWPELFTLMPKEMLATRMLCSPTGWLGLVSWLIQQVSGQWNDTFIMFIYTNKTVTVWSVLNTESPVPNSLLVLTSNRHIKSRSLTVHNVVGISVNQFC